MGVERFLSGTPSSAMVDDVLLWEDSGDGRRGTSGEGDKRVCPVVE